MSIPGFTAEASIGPTTQVYRVQDRYGAAMASGMYPQLNGGDMDFGGEEDLDNEAAIEMAPNLAVVESEEDLSNEAGMEMAEDIVEADSDEGLGDEAAMEMAEHIVGAEDDLEGDAV